MKRIDGINVIPFIDIMLVLLAIVLTTATFIVDGRLEIRLPESAAKSQPSAEDRIELAIDREGNVFIDTAPTTLAELEEYLSTLSPATPIVLRVDAEARFAGFVAIVDLLKAREMDKLTILTRQPAA